MSRLSPKSAARLLVQRLPTRAREPMLKAVAGRRRGADVERILRDEAFDQRWYEAQTGRHFASAADACLDYLRRGRRSGFSPHPLFEPSMVDPKRWTSKRATDPLLASLTGKAGKNGQVHLAVPDDWSKRVDGVPVWLAWARAAGDSTPMPTLDERDEATGGTGVEPVTVPITWGEFRARALAVAAELHQSRSLVEAPRVAPHRPARTNAAPSVARRRRDGDEPLVSIVLPTWNRAPMIRRAVQSVQAQTLKDWELIVVDDGSTDDTLLVLEGLAHWDQRIRVVAAPHGGVCRARNTAIAAATGRYVAFLDSDNTWNADFLERATDFVAERGVPWAHAAMQLEGEQSTTYRALEGDLEHLLIANYIDLNVLIAERAAVEQVGGFDESLRRAVDYDLVLKLCVVSPPCLIPTIGAVYSDDDEDTSRISVVEPMAWNQVVRVRHLVDAATEADREVVEGRISVVLVLRNPLRDTVRFLDRLLGEPGDIELIVVAAGPNNALVRMLELAALSRPALSIVRWPTRNLDLAGLNDLGAARATGEFLTVWAPNHWPSGPWADALRATLDDPAVAMVQPLVRNNSGTINSAGAVFVGTDPCPSPLLAGCPIEDAAALGTSPVPAALGGTFMMRRRDFWTLGGLDPIYANSFAEVDLSVRASRAGLGATLVTTAAQVRGRPYKYTGFTRDPAKSVEVLRTRLQAPAGSAQAWERVGFEQVGRRVEPLSQDPDVVELGASPIVRPRLLSVREDTPTLRWAIDIAAPAGERGLQWGDTHFAESLATSLRGLGQWVHVDRREARDGSHRDYDDVTLVIRGLDLVVPRPGDVSLLWIISHPDMVTAGECAVFDDVFAASVTWAADRTAEWGLPVQPLLQCTDARIFGPDAGTPDTAADVVFVGNARGNYRPAVRYAIEVGADPVVFGGGWASLIPEDLVHGEYVPNADLPALYASAGVVLNDHWEDMRRDGFVSNRVFDVLACAGRLITDEVSGLDPALTSAVRTFRSRRDMADLLAGSAWRASFPDRAARLQTSELVRAEHTFDARARTLLDAAVARHRAVHRSGSPDARRSA